MGFDRRRYGTMGADSEGNFQPGDADPYYDSTGQAGYPYATPTFPNVDVNGSPVLAWLAPAGATPIYSYDSSGNPVTVPLQYANAATKVQFGQQSTSLYSSFATQLAAAGGATQAQAQAALQAATNGIAQLQLYSPWTDNANQNYADTSEPYGTSYPPANDVLQNYEWVQNNARSILAGQGQVNVNQGGPATGSENNILSNTITNFTNNPVVWPPSWWPSWLPTSGAGLAALAVALVIADKAL